MARIIALSNQKGGVGKTTSAVNIAASLGQQKRRVLLVDLDPQGNATMGSGIDKSQVDYTISDVLLGEVTLSQCIKPTPNGYDCAPANGDLTVAEVNLLGRGKARESVLKKCLATVTDKYDYIIIDCPPALNVLTLNALSAAHSVLIPMQCEYYALEGLAALLGTIEQIQQSINPQLEIEGILRTMYDPRNRLATDVSAQLLEHFTDKVYRTVIPRNVRLAEAPSHGLSALHYDKRSQGACAYLVLASEMIRKHSKVSKNKKAEIA